MYVIIIQIRKILLSLHAPEDFLVEEFITFAIKDTQIPKDQISEFLEKNVSYDLKILEGKIVYDKNIDIHLEIPFQISELGYRRHYRLPDVDMLGKKVLLITESKKLTHSIQKMFMYFGYEVDNSIEAFKKHGNDLSQYDILVIDDIFATDTLEEIIVRIQDEIPFKYVVLRGSHIVEVKHSGVVSTHLIKPVTQESVFELISSLFHNDVKSASKRSNATKHIVDLEKLLGKDKSIDDKTAAVNHLTNDNFTHVIDRQRETKLTLLDIKKGEENCKKSRTTYVQELKKFLETFDRSDIYFRQIVNEKSSNKIKSFCIDLERQAKLIGAESMLRFAGIVSLIFVHDKLDMLPIYPGRYHIELQNLLGEIRKHLGMKD